mmetsp:Transcript_104851/g.262636  ORF Transcript_104851/g.262636 Transcript_104851/m.262636 type:complete len:236 (-) Transcript_104851:26-733(-)
MSNSSASSLALQVAATAAAEAVASGGGAVLAVVRAKGVPATDRRQWRLFAARRSSLPRCPNHSPPPRPLAEPRPTMMSMSGSASMALRMHRRPWSKAPSYLQGTSSLWVRWQAAMARASRCSRRWASKAAAWAGTTTALPIPSRCRRERTARACRTRGKWLVRTFTGRSPWAGPARSRSCSRLRRRKVLLRAPPRVGKKKRMPGRNDLASSTRQRRKWRVSSRARCASSTCAGQR